MLCMIVNNPNRGGRSPHGCFGPNRRRTGEFVHRSAEGGPGMAEPIDPTVPDRAADPSARPDSLSRQIYAALREGIIRGRYPQGSRLTEQRLAEELTVSRVPLREAVPLLEVDGFVRTLPRRSAIVSSWTVKSAHELFDLRLCLEVGAARYAARQVAAGASTEALRTALRDAESGLRSDDPYVVAQQSTEFHE